MRKYSLSRAASNIQTSDVRDLLHYAQRPDMISMAGGLPAAELMDVDGLRAAAASALADSSGACLQYGVTEGQPALKEALIEHLANKGTQVSADSIIVTSGSQQASTLSAARFSIRVTSWSSSARPTSRPFRLSACAIPGS